MSVDYDWVTSRIATGAALNSPADIDQMVADGVTAILDARAEFDDGSLFAQHPKVLYCWNPTEDNGAPKPVDYWAKTIGFALPLLGQVQHRVYFHCAAGCNRGPSNALAVMVALGWTKDEAAALIKKARPVAQIAYADNAAQAAALIIGAHK